MIDMWLQCHFTPVYLAAYLSLQALTPGDSRWRLKHPGTCL